MNKTDTTPDKSLEPSKVGDIEISARIYKESVRRHRAHLEAVTKGVITLITAASQPPESITIAEVGQICDTVKNSFELKASHNGGN